LRNLSQEIDQKETILQSRAVDANVVRELEAAGEGAVGNAAMEEFTSGLARSFGGDAEKVLLNNDFDFVGGKTRDRESDAVGIRTGLRNVVGRIVVDRFIGAVDERIQQPIEANGGAVEGYEFFTHGGSPIRAMTKQ